MQVCKKQEEERLVGKQKNMCFKHQVALLVTSNSIAIKCRSKHCELQIPESTKLVIHIGEC